MSDVAAHPADVGGHAGLRPQALNQTLQQGRQVDLVDGGFRQQLTDPPHRPRRGVPHHHTGVLHQLDQSRHRLKKQKKKAT